MSGKLAPMSDDVGRACSDERKDEDQHGEIERILAADAARVRPFHRHPNAQAKRHGHCQAITMQGKRAEVYEDGMHVVIPFVKVSVCSIPFLNAVAPPCEGWRIGTQS